MIILALTGEHEIFYLQERIGFKNKKFSIIKFATMLKNSATIGTGTITLPGDSRVLPFGKILRFTKINELPQLINIFLGQMSFVGPRPLVERGWMKYPENIRNIIYNSKPGLTGVGSIVFRDEASYVAQFEGTPQEIYISKVFPYKGKLEMWYQQNASFWTDIKIIFLTAWVIVFSKSNLHTKWLKKLPIREL
jgi:lipopolysaccharide/colanic/teichoic acid biosynthesis glycosyltransferase